MRLKRGFDIVVSLSALIALSPVIAAVALAVRLRDGSPVLFRQQRSGKDGQTFVLHKFRTMSKIQTSSNSDFDPTTDSDRLTPLGGRLRDLSLDELPSLVNVIAGNMSLVGPRPLPERYLERYSAEQRRRLEVPPGITGLAQVKGRNLLGWEERFALDVEYVDRRSFVGDLKLLVETIVPVIRRQGVAADGEATMTEFMGSQRPTGEKPGDQPKLQAS